ncbi:hypothetical protein GOBAR_AA30521 [Gossypium barbadense]|uniref:SWIM-type domain-containing protein n=1 Tax=Gossypium barbadense TaxID=3634 RepID=A0A2P5WGE7_GOSBA|nr:hypothetical protein GOBAR_AA30521 [Gossypium barbadense]
MVQTHLASGSPYLELYVQFSSSNDAFAISTSNAVREEYMTPARHSVSGWQNMEAPVFCSSMEYTTPARHFVGGWDMHLKEGMMYSLRHPPARGPRSLQMMVGRMMSPMWIYLESSAPMVQKLDYFFEREPVPTIPEDVEGGSDEEEEDLRFKVYSPSAHMHNVNLSQDDALEFPDLPHRKHDRTSSSSNSSEIEVGREFSNKGSFLTALKQHSIMSGVNYNVVKSKSNKFEAKCALQDGTCSWKIMTSLRKRTGLWEIKKYKGPHTCVGGYEICKDRFHEMLAILCSVNEEGTDYLCNIRFEQWTQAYDNLRYGYMTSNLAECINSILKGTRHLPIITVVRETYFRLAVLFPKRAASYKGQMQGGHVWCAKVLREINKVKARANTMHIVCHDHDNLWFHVTEFDRLNQGIIGGQYRVHSRNRACDCGVFDALRYPCVHVIAACQNIRLDPMTYVDQVYKIEYMYNVWRQVFPPIPDGRKWSSVSLAPFKLLPDKELRRKPKGRPCSTRVHNNMDIREAMNQQRLCEWCKNPGHITRSCPNRNS